MTYLGLVVHGLALAVMASGIAKLIDDSAASASIRAAQIPVLTVAARPGRIVGAAEVAVGVFTVAVPGVAGPAVLGALYGGFVWFVLRLRARDPAASCGCIGSTHAPPGRLHLGVSAVALLVCVAGITEGVPDVTHATGDTIPGVLVYVGTTIPVALLTLFVPALTRTTPDARE